MRFLTETECAQWAADYGYLPANAGVHGAQSLPHLSIQVPQDTKQLAFSRLISQCLSPRRSCLLWVVEHDIWPSSENWHLYYRLRQSYGDARLLDEAPGHLFLDYEAADFVTFLQLAVSFGWGAEILPRLTAGASTRAFLSHDEFVVLASSDGSHLPEWQTAFEPRFEIWPGTA